MNFHEFDHFKNFDFHVPRVSIMADCLGVFLVGHVIELAQSDNSFYNLFSVIKWFPKTNQMKQPKANGFSPHNLIVHPKT